MRWRKRKYKALIVLSLLGLLILLPVAAQAAQSHSTSYQVNEVFFGSGGALNDCSMTYCAKEAIGETAVGRTKGTAYQAQAGFNTDRYPFLQFVVNGVNTNVGVLSTGSTTTTTATFSVKNYLSSGYAVFTISNPPKNNNYTMSALGSPTLSSHGVEQFGMNLTANTCPTPSSTCSGTLGASPVQVPGTAFSFGQADSATGYATPNKYEYIPGSEIAYSNSSSGETDYTISYIYNISNLTAGGSYSFNDVLVATATF